MALSPRRSLLGRTALRGPLLVLALLALLALAACGTHLKMDPLEPDAGISASLRVVESRTQALFAELERNASAPFSEYDAIHYRPLLDELANAQKLARLHERPAKERSLLDTLAGTYEEMSGQHREGKLSFASLRDFRTRFDMQIGALLRAERR
jgi:hypothetical protein